MSVLVSGEYFAIPVNSADSEFKISLDVEPETFSATGKRLVKVASQEATQKEDLQHTIKNAVDEVKKGGWKSALSLGKRMLEKALEDEKPAPVVEAPDPLNPAVAFSFDETSNVHYNLVKWLKDKEKRLDYHEFRSERGYGVLIPQGDGLFLEVSFIYPSYEYAEKHYPEQNVGRGVPTWRREDDILHRMRMYYLSMDESQARHAAGQADFEQEKKKYFEVDLASTRDEQKTLFSTPDLDLDAKTGELSLRFLRAWFLPTQTKEGRQIQYDWDALRISIMSGSDVVSRRVCWSRNDGREAIASQENWFELMNTGYFGELKPGSYSLTVDIYGHTLMTYPFEIVEMTVSDINSKFDRYLAMKSPEDTQLKIKQCMDSFELDVYYPLARHLDLLAESDEFEIFCRLEKDGVAWPDYEMDYFASSNMKQSRTVINKADWWDEPLHLQIPFADRAEREGRQAAEDGVYTLYFELGDERRLLDSVQIEMKGGVLQGESSHPLMPLADFVFPNEHSGVVITL